ncbi:MAG: alpha/beta fold hydrolase [Ilumatobacteraceae bacterium]
MTTESVTQLTADRIDVRSADGTQIAVWVDGDGPALVMVHGSIADHTTFEPFVAVLRHHFTTFAMDRRGFGASGDTTDYSIERDFADVAAVVDAVAARTGEPVALWGHSYGANCAMGGATLTGNIHHLVLYEPSLGLRYPPGSIENIEAALARVDHDGAIVAVLVDILEMTDDEIAALRASPLWPLRLAAAPTIPRECHAEENWVYQEGRFGRITAPGTHAGRLRQRPHRHRGHRARRSRDPRRARPRPRRTRPLRPQDRPRPGHCPHPAIHRRRRTNPVGQRVATLIRRWRTRALTRRA